MKSKIIPSIIFCIFFICNHLSFAQIITPKDTTTAVINGKLFYVHKVIKNESLYGIARDYNITVKEITDANPKIGNGLKAGRILYIPIKAVKNPSNPPTDKFVDTSKNKSFVPTKESFEVGLLLPFNFPSREEMDSVETFFDKSWNANTISSLEFYEGVIMALDSLKKKGLHLDLHTYNISDDSLETVKLLDNADLKKMNLIIGPIFNSHAYVFT